jgi:hypothetical protein
MSMNAGDAKCCSRLAAIVLFQTMSPTEAARGAHYLSTFGASLQILAYTESLRII